MGDMNKKRAGKEEEQAKRMLYIQNVYPQLHLKQARTKRVPKE